MTTVTAKTLPSFRKALYRDSIGKRFKVFYGGAGSGKSHAIAQAIARMFIEHDDLKILVTRKTGPALRITAYQLVIDILHSWGVPFQWNKTHMELRSGTSTILFRSLDDPEKVKSLDVNVVWIEEATELNDEDFRQLNLRLRRNHPTVDNIMFLSFNPIDMYHWAVTELVQNPGPDVFVHHSTYKDNPFLPEVYRRELEDLINKDENFYRVYTLGLPGVLRNIIYTNWDVFDISIAPHHMMVTKPDGTTVLLPPSRYAIDFGYNDAMVVLAIWRHDGEYWVHELLYTTKFTNADLIEWLRREGNIAPGVPFYCDPSRPDQIEELLRAGFPAEKANNKVKDGIDYVKGHKVHISGESVSTLNEIRGYKYKEVKAKEGGRKRVLDEPVDFMNHAMDAMRYGIFTEHPPDWGDNVPEHPMPLPKPSNPANNIPLIYKGNRPPW